MPAGPADEDGGSTRSRCRPGDEQPLRPPPRALQCRGARVGLLAWGWAPDPSRSSQGRRIRCDAFGRGSRGVRARVRWPCGSRSWDRGGYNGSAQGGTETRQSTHCPELCRHAAVGPSVGTRPGTPPVDRHSSRGWAEGSRGDAAGEGTRDAWTRGGGISRACRPSFHAPAGRHVLNAHQAAPPPDPITGGTSVVANRRRNGRPSFSASIGLLQLTLATSAKIAAFRDSDTLHAVGGCRFGQS